MNVLSLIKNFKNKISDFFNGECDCRNKDKINLNLDGLKIMIERCFAYDKPHEVSVFVPRAELRKRVLKDGDVIEEIEILLNSITVVHSPQRPSDEGGGPPPEPPEIPRRDKKLKNKK